MDFLSTDITNPMFAGYANECDFRFAIDSIANECGTCIESSNLSDALIEKGIDPKDLSPHQLDLIDDTFYCF